MVSATNIEDGPDTISILLTTDNHVGYKELDPIVGNDSWKTFHEVTQIAKDRDVDMILQGGDLFHINKPSKKSMFHVIKSLRMNCMGDRPCEMELLSDPSVNFSNGFNTVNYEDANFNISVPVFAISGNHDDATGDGMLLPIDILSIAGLVNHFGKIENNEDITVSPVLLQKGTTKLALYGMSNIRDERLHRAFRDGLVKFQRPTLCTEEWFNLLCFHQNHAEHSRTSHIPENFLPKFLNFILWGHEHECIPNPVFNPDTGFDVLQAGSSIATSLSDGEQREKHVFIMRINGNKYSLEPVKLKTVRPFLLEEVVLLESRLIPGESSKADVLNFLVGRVESLIERATDEYKENNPDLFEDAGDSEANKRKIPLPLIRLKVDYSGGFELENARRFSNKFVEKIANVNDVLQFYKKKTRVNNPMIQSTKFSEAGLSEDVNDAKPSEAQLQDLIKVFLHQAELNLLPEQGMAHAVEKFVENEDKHIINQYINSEIEQETKMLLALNINDDGLYEEGEQQAKKVFKNLLKQIKAEPRNLDDTLSISRTSTIKPSARRPKSVANRKGSKKSAEIVADSDSGDDNDNGNDNDNGGFDLSDIELDNPPPPSAPRRTRNASNKKSTVIEIDSNSGEDDDYQEDIVQKSPPKKASRGGDRNTKAPAKKTAPASKSRKATKAKESGNGSLFDDIMSMGS